MKIIPSIGRRVWYAPNQSDLKGSHLKPMYCADSSQAFDAGIAYVCEDEDMIYVSVSDHSGEMHRRGPVAHASVAQPGEASWDWMPYQKETASKHVLISPIAGNTDSQAIQPSQERFQ